MIPRKISSKILGRHCAEVVLALPKVLPAGNNDFCFRSGCYKHRGCIIASHPAALGSFSAFPKIAYDVALDVAGKLPVTL